MITLAPRTEIGTDVGEEMETAQGETASTSAQSEEKGVEQTGDEPSLVNETTSEPQRQDHARYL